MYCTIPMSALRTSPFNLVYGDLIQVRAQAYNMYGWGDVSNPAGSLTVATEPTQMSQPIRDPTTTISLLKLSWTALSSAAETGGAIITSYDVQWDGGTSGANWYHLQGFGSPDLPLQLRLRVEWSLAMLIKSKSGRRTYTDSGKTRQQQRFEQLRHQPKLVSRPWLQRIVD
jgi:hypothetical protein